MAENEKAVPLEAAEPTEVPSVMGATFAERAKARQGSKAVQSAENKAVKSARKKG